MSGFKAMQTPVLETERLILRGFEERDFDCFCAIYDDPDHVKFIGGAEERWSLWRRMSAYIGHWQLRGFGFFVLEEKSSGAFVGYCGPWRPESWPENEIGYAILKDQQGKGYVTEAVIRSLQYAYQYLGWTTAISFIDAENSASQVVAERLGAVKDGEGLIFGQNPAEI